MTLTQTTKAVLETASKQSLFQRICNKLGENNKPIFTVLAIACGKGTVRPILSITDKKEKPDARKYAALRELMTEFIGVPTTLFAGLAAESLTGLLEKNGSKSYSCIITFRYLCGSRLSCSTVLQHVYATSYEKADAKL